MKKTKKAGRSRKAGAVSTQLRRIGPMGAAMFGFSVITETSLTTESIARRVDLAAASPRRTSTVSSTANRSAITTW